MPPHAPPLAYAIGAHPDDVEIFCLGLLLRLRALGWRIGWAIATDGERGGDPAVRRGEAIAAAASCGVAPDFLGLPDGGVATARGGGEAVAACLARHRPALAVTHAPWDYHPDHRALARFVVDACPCDRAVVFADALLGIGPQPDVLVDVSDHLPIKRAALDAHLSQAGVIASSALAAWVRLRGAQTFDPAVSAAEAYFLPKGPMGVRAMAALASVIVRTRWNGEKS